MARETDLDLVTDDEDLDEEDLEEELESLVESEEATSMAGFVGGLLLGGSAVRYRYSATTAQ